MLIRDFRGANALDWDKMEGLLPAVEAQGQADGGDRRFAHHASPNAALRSCSVSRS